MKATRAASSGMISGVGFARAKTMGLGAMRRRCFAPKIIHFSRLETRNNLALSARLVQSDSLTNPRDSVSKPRLAPRRAAAQHRPTQKLLCVAAGVGRLPRRSRLRRPARSRMQAKLLEFFPQRQSGQSQ